MRETATAIYIIIGIVVLGFHIYLAYKANQIAIDKGYGDTSWGALCFFFPVAYIIVAGMPDKKQRELQEKTNQLLEQMTVAQVEAAAPVQVAAAKTDELSSLLPDL